jgi:hypothetical protein
MSIISVLRDHPEKIRRISQVGPEVIPAFALIAADGAVPEDLCQLAIDKLRGLLVRANVALPDDPTELDILQCAIAHFMSILKDLRPVLIVDAAAAVRALAAAPLFQMSTELQLDCVSFAVFLLGRDDPDFGAMGRRLLETVHSLAEARGNMEVLVAANSVLALFPDG